ncbi:MAG: hypothetical protein AB4426_28175 [Xenococcaceae cyanobacterium]
MNQIRSLYGKEAFRWTQTGGMESLGGSFPREATGVSANGSTVVGWIKSRSGTEPFRWTQTGGMERLGELLVESVETKKIGSLADVSVSADGSIVVGSIPQTGAFIWDSTNGMRSLKSVLTDLGLDLTCWHLEQVTGISDDGLTIVGRGTNPQGYSVAWIARLD